MTTPFSGLSCSRRTFLAGAATLPALSRRARGAAADGTLRVGIVGCGGRGTGAGLQALADPGVRVVALADLFGDQVESCADLLAATGERGVVPPGRRHVGPSAWLDLLAAPLDAVILAATPASRPAHLAAAVAAGLHCWCETPAAIDPAGLAAAGVAMVEARRRGLVVGAGLCGRFDPPTAGTVARIRDGAIGAVRSIALHHDGNLPWRRILPAGTPGGEARVRNWISVPELSGGHFVEHQVHALDRALWILGDDDLPVAVEPVLPVEPPAEGGFAALPAGIHVRYAFASGASVAASCRRSDRAGSGTAETVCGSRGHADLIAGRVEAAGGGRWQAMPVRADGRGEMFAAGMAAFLRRIHASGEGSDGTTAGFHLLRATALAVAGAEAAAGRNVDPRALFSQTGTA